jgi:hypothetical protein
MLPREPQPGFDHADLGPASGQGVSLVPSLDAPVKLIIWDLDETLWKGTLSEGLVVLDQAHAEIEE